MCRNWFFWIPLVAILALGETYVCWSSATSELPQASAFHDFYEDFGYPTQLGGWEAYGQSPWNESREGITHNLSSNHIQGELSNSLPRNSTHIFLSCKNSSLSIPVTSALMNQLHHLNMSDNYLYKDLPRAHDNSSIQSELYLKNSNDTGSCILLASLHLAKMKYQDNNLRIVTPSQSHCVPNGWRVDCACVIGGIILLTTCFVAIITILSKRPMYGQRFRFPARADYEGRVNRAPHSCEDQSSPRFRRPDVYNSAALNIFQICDPTSREYTYKQLDDGTDKFVHGNLLGIGSLGPVYTARFSDNNQIFAVKNITAGAILEEVFKDVIASVEQLSHLNIIPLVGYCKESGMRFLVYKYVSGAITLENALPHLRWTVRIEIAFAIANALVYLHKFAYHGNLKAANVLLDDKLVPHISDCGLARLRGDFQPGKNYVKEDIYQYGVLLLVLISGRKPSDSEIPGGHGTLVVWASSILQDSHSVQAMVDPVIGAKNIPPKVLKQFSDVVASCLQDDPMNRLPMEEVVEGLYNMENQQ